MAEVIKFDRYVEQAKLRMKYHPLYRGEGPVLTAVEVGPAQAPADDVVTFS